MTHTDTQDIRFAAPLYTFAEAARFLGVPTSTFGTWAKGYVRRPPGRPPVRGVSILDDEIGIDHALASKRVYTDGAVILFDYADAQQDDELAGLTEVISRQQVLAPVVREYLQRIEYGKDGWAERVVSPTTRDRIVVVDPRRAFGQPIFVHGAAPVESVVSRSKAGEALADVARDFGVPPADVEDYLRAAVPLAA